MSDRAESQVIRLTDLPARRPTRFALAPEGEELSRLTEAMGLLGLRKLSFKGSLTPRGKRDWTLAATLGATVIQPCVVTLEPVTTRIDEEILRHYLADFTEPEESEAEMPDDDTTEALPATLDLAAVMEEALALSLPAFPRAEGVELGEKIFTEPGAAPMRDDEVKPFAGLADLKKRMEE